MSEWISLADAMVLVVGIVFAYLLGGIPFGYLAGWLKGRDIRKEGSGNIGATNVFRTLGKKWGVLVFILDFLKGFLPAILAGVYGAVWVKAVPPDGVAVIVGFVALLGHNYTPFLGFKGGKGIATSAGVLVALMPLAFLVSILGWGISMAVSRIVSLSSIVSALLLPIGTAWFYRDSEWLVGVSILMMVMAIWRHRANISRLIAGTEPRAGGKKV